MRNKECIKMTRTNSRDVIDYFESKGAIKFSRFLTINVVGNYCCIDKNKIITFHSEVPEGYTELSCCSDQERNAFLEKTLPIRIQFEEREEDESKELSIKDAIDLMDYYNKRKHTIERLHNNKEVPGIIEKLKTYIESKHELIK